MENMSYQNNSQNIYKQYTSHCRVSGSAMCTVYIYACVITKAGPNLGVFQPPKSDLCSLPYPRSIQLFSLVDRAPRETKQEFFSFFLLFISQLFLNRFASFKRQTTLKITPEIIRLFKKNKPRFRRGQPRFRPRLTLMLFFLSSLNFSAVSQPICLI